MRFFPRPARHGFGKAVPRGISRRRIGRRGSVFLDAPGMIAAEPFFGPGPRTTISVAGGRFRAVAGRDRTERSFMRFERRYPAAAGFSLPHPRRSRTNSPSESSWTWTRPPLRRRTRLPTPRLPCRRFSAGAAFSLTNMSGKNLPPFGGGGFRSRRGGLSAGCQRRVRAVACGPRFWRHLRPARNSVAIRACYFLEGRKKF